MYPFWAPVIAPLVAISRANRIVEIGALRGETTVKMLEDLGPDAELHVIDPLPQFDPAEHERRFPGQYIFHRALSLDVLPDLGAVDVALVDGDHNWYTVYHELGHLRRAARDADRPLPLLILHDVGWPYGRRDLYYEPSQIPEEFRQPHDRRGMTPGRTQLLRGGGMNITLDNAIEEGGARNGVRTALDDFAAEHDRPLRQVILPIYFGLAIVAEDAYLDAHPEVASYLDQLDSDEGVRELLELSERIRLDEVVFAHNIERMRNERLGRATSRHLSLLRASLNDEHYVHNEDRINYLLSSVVSGQPVDPEALRAPEKTRAQNIRDLDRQKRTGARGVGGGQSLAYAAMGRDRLDQLDEALRSAVAATSDGDLVEVGCERGGGAIYMRGFLDAMEIDDRDVWVADEFRASPPSGARALADAGLADLWPDLNHVRDGFARYGLLDERVRFVQGPIDDTLSDAPMASIALLRIGPTVDAGTVLSKLYDRVTDGGVVVVDGPDAAASVESFRVEQGITVFDRVGSTGVAWQKVAPGAVANSTEASAHIGPNGSGRTDRPVDTVDLSVVVVFHNMKREAERTLHSLSRTYQRDLGGLSYEVIAVENGSRADQRLGAEYVESFGPEFHYLDMGEDASPSPTEAMNRGIELSRGVNLALMIDGAHLLSPGVFRHAMTALAGPTPTVVATQQWYVGPGQQPEVVAKGYDQTREDALFNAIDWPSDGYRVFEISHFIGERDWFDGILESNCLFVPRALLEQVGGFDDRFSMPGGGYANLEFLERIGSHPDLLITTIIGEGSFHQVHGGTTTNEGELDARRAKTFAYGEDYRTNWGRAMQGAAKQMHYVGSFTTAAARRTRSRRMTAMRFGRGRLTSGVDSMPTEPQPIPDELSTSFIDAFWHSLAWQGARWLGTPVGKAPTDLFVYQELLDRVRPDQIIVRTDGAAGLPLYLANVADLLGHGRVVALGPPGGSPIDHDRVEVVATDDPHEALEHVVRLVGSDPHALVVLGGGGTADELCADFERYSPFVRPGSYVIFEDTIVNGRPVWPAYGPGPLEAIRRLTRTHGDFLQDTDVERFGLTFNRGGYLRRKA